MSLSALLLPTSKGDRKAQKFIDNDLDTLFRTNAVAVQKVATPISIASPGVKKKRKLEEKPENAERLRTGNEGSKRKRVTSNAEVGAARRPTYIPTDETPERRDARTIFVGNLPVEVAQKRPLLKQLQRHILAQVPSAKIESTRFRSVPFQNPTSKLPTSDDEGGTSTTKPLKRKHEPSTAKQARPHDRDRTSSWRERQTEDADDGGKSDEKKFLNDNQKKKIAFINQEFHSTADTVNAYMVFAHPVPIESRPSNLPPLLPVMDPYEAASLAVENCDGTVFMERMIRVDAVTKGVHAGVKIKDGANGVDPKLSVFVGNLDFATKEEDLRAFFEGVVSAERGPPSEDEAEGEVVKKPKTWVTRVRIVRDKETQLGKGFAYVQFMDRPCVDEVLALEETQLKFAKRKLRVQRCKTLPGGSSSSNLRHTGTDTPSSARQKSTSTPVPIIPKGDPFLGEKIAHLPKDARKEFKSSDADRVARRLAKKKARIALAKGGVKTQVGDRDRVRKGPTSVNKGSGPRKKEKGRVRSDKSLAKRNIKK